MAHTHEVVENLVHWFDDKIFRLYPTWEDCVRNGIFSTPQLESFFGPNTGGGGGYANYAQCAERGIGRNVIAKMLAGTASADEIRKAMDKTHTHEVVYQLVHWFDDKIFTLFPM